MIRIRIRGGRLTACVLAAAVALVPAVAVALVPGVPAVADSHTERDGDYLCAPDPADDTFWFAADGSREPEAFPRADIREFCAEFGEEIVLEVVLAEAEDPEQDPAWDGETAAYWFVDTTTDGAFDHVVIYERGADGVLGVEVRESRDGGELRCTATPGFDPERRALIATGIDPEECLGAPDHVLVTAVTAYDSDPEEAEGPVYLDFAAHDVGVGRAGTSTLRTAERLRGENRFETAAAIAEARYPDPDDAAEVYLARSDDFADALAAGSVSKNPSTDGPVLLVPSCGEVPAVVRDQIDRLDPTRVTALGGEAAICGETLAEAADGRGIRRLAGEDRFGTAVEISLRAFLDPDRAEAVYLATAWDFPDALAAGPLEDGPLLLVPACDTLPGVVADEIDRLDVDRVVALGGQNAVCDDVLEQARTAGGADRDADRLAGTDRFGTAVAVSRAVFEEGAPVVYISRADAFPDALAGAALEGGPILLLPSCGHIPPQVAEEIRRLDPERVVALGGSTAVCVQMLRHAANA